MTRAGAGVTAYENASYDAVFRETPQVPPEGCVALYDVSYAFLAVLLRVRFQSTPTAERAAGQRLPAFQRRVNKTLSRST